VALGVEELGRLQVGSEVLVLDRDRLDRDRADELRGAVLAHDQLGVHAGEAAAERGEHVLDGEAGGRVDAVVRVGGGRNGGGQSGHVVSPLRRFGP
jgi:hypothetical protein